MIFIKNFKQEHGEGIKTKMKNKRRQGGKKEAQPSRQPGEARAN